MEWQEEWFNEDYLKLYSSRDDKEACRQALFICNALNLKPKDRLLDAGCGKGRHAFIFAKMGLEVVGIDQSKTLIKEALRKLAKDPLPNLSFLQGDIKNYTAPIPFDAAISVFTSFGYYTQDAKNLKMLQSIHRNLKKEGLFFLDYLNPEYVKTHLIPFEEMIIDNEQITLKRRIEKAMVIKEIFFPKRHYTEKVKLYDLKSLEKLLHQAQFSLIQTFGSYQLQDLTSESERQILIAKAH